jgi:PAS domain S-box-containing protein
MDGFEVCERLKRTPETTKIPVIFVTVKDRPEDIARGFEVGAVDYVTRPFSEIELLSRVFTHLELKKFRDLIAQQNLQLIEQNSLLEQQNKELQELYALKEKNFSDTLRKQAYELHKRVKELRTSENNLTRAQRIGRLGNWVWDVRQQTLIWSDELYRTFGVERGVFQVTYEGIEAMIHPEDRQKNTEQVQRMLSTADAGEWELRIIRPDGQMRYIYQSLEVSHAPDGQVDRIFGIIQDITERKQVEEALRESREQLRNLSMHVEALREEERTTIAREIHDELGQMLTALKMDLVWLKRRLTDEQASLLDKIASMESLINITLSSVKRLATDLRPGLLDDLGLSAAIKWQAGEFQQHTGIPCDVSIAPEEIIVNEALSTAVFRIFQEALTNVARHAQATHVQVLLQHDVTTLTLEVKDSGKGITTAQIANPKSFGLIGIRERVQFLGGQVTFQGVPNKGTTVTVTIPLE